MGDIKWSEEQRRIIDDRKGNLLVSAAAGAGKTAVLVERIFELIADESLGIDIDRLLVMTFTKDAAAQMRERLADRMSGALVKDPENRRLLRQQMLLRNAQIVTIDSFCNSVVKEFFHEIDIDPCFRIGQTAELKLIRNEVLSALLEECYEAHQRDFIDMVESYCPTKNDDRLEDLILRLADAAEAQAWPAEWLDRLEAEFVAERDGRSGMKGQWDEYLTAYVHMMCAEALVRVDEGLTLCRMERGPHLYEETLINDKAYIEGLMATGGYAELQARFNEKGFERISTKKEDRDESIAERVKEIRDEYKDIISEKLKKKFFIKTCEEIEDELKAAAGPVVTLIGVTREFMKRFHETKRERNILDFSDIEHFTLEILACRDEDGNITARPAAKELNRRYKEIFVDEYQDSNFVQEAIVEVIAVTAGDSAARPYTFMVGDVKQSIYRFRMAKPELFMNRFKAYRDVSASGEAISLGRNFRSRPEVLDSVNDVFYLAMREGIGGINYDREAALVCGQREVAEDGLPTDSDCLTELIAVSKGALAEDGDSASTAADMRELEAKYAAKRVRELIDSGYIVNKGTKDAHKAAYGDIAILLRSLKGWADAYTEAFETEGIPVYCDTGAGFLASYEISVMLNFLRILDNPMQDIPLTAVLHSAIGECSEDDLVSIRTYGGMNVPFWEAVTDYAENGPEEALKAKLKHFTEIYRQLKSMNLSRDIDRVIGSIYDLTGFYLYCAALPGGERRAANLDILMNYASDYEASSFSGLFSFVRYLEQIIESEQDLDEAVNAEAGNSVRIMSVHKSKGLEFPIVILGGMCRQIMNLEGNQGVIISSDFGIGANCIRLDRRTKIRTLRRSILQLMIKLDNMGEELRLLYVAMTRAKQKLIMIGATKDLGGATGVWERMAAREPDAYPVPYIAGASSYMDFVYPAALLNDKDFIIRRENGEPEGASDGDEGISERDDSFEKLKKSYTELEDGGCENIRRLLDFKYRYEYVEALPVKLSVSEIKHASMIEEGELTPWMDLDNEGRRRDGVKKHADTKEKTHTGAGGNANGDAAEQEPGADKLAGNERGTLYHKIMQFIPFKPATSEEVGAFLDSLSESGIIDDTERKCLEPSDFAAFLSTELAARMQCADEAGHLRREQPFVLGRRACDIDSVKYAGVTDIIPVQGIIDCMFGEDGRYVILDYKTDKVAPGQEDLLVRRYHSQLENYAEAVSRIIGAPVKECYIYSFTLRSVIRL